MLRPVCVVAAVASRRMTEANSEAREWMLTWTRSGIRPPDMFHPLADEYADIDGLERALDIPVGTPVLINPDGGCDVALSEFFRSPHFNPSGFIEEVLCTRSEIVGRVFGFSGEDLA